MHPSNFATSKPEHPAIVMASSGITISYAELEMRSNACAHLLRRQGLTKGQGIAILMDNSRYFLEVRWAAQRSGLYFTCVPTHLNAEEAEYIIRDCGALAVFFNSATKDVGKELAARLSPTVHSYSVECEIDGCTPYSELCQSMPNTPVSDESSGRDMLYSSGTTGKPKGVKIPLSDEPISFMNPMQIQTQVQYGFGEDTVYLCPAPLYHAAPLRVTMLIQRLGGTAVILDKFHAETALRTIDQYQVTHSQWVPTMFVRMLKLKKETRAKFALDSQRVAIHAAAPCPQDIKRQMIDWWGPIIHEYYSGSEPCGLCCIDSQQWLENPGSVGPAVFGSLHVLDEAGNELPAFQEGLIYFSGGLEFQYHGDPQKTKEAKNEKGWVTLGDIGYVDEKQYLYLTDRASNVIISGGVNIYPQECEDLLLTHDSVLDVAVIGVSNADFGEEVKAFVQLVDPAEAGPHLEQVLLDFCRDSLSPVKCPRSVDFIETLPRQANGKLYKRLLKESHS